MGWGEKLRALRWRFIVYGDGMGMGARLKEPSW
jgi:hypothetical protein